MAAGGSLGAIYCRGGGRAGLKPLEQVYGAGQRTYHPALLLCLLVYGYATGVFSSRKIERATFDSVAFRFIAAGSYPVHDTLATFRRRFLDELRGIFVQVLELAQEMSLLKLGTISLDGTKVHANASHHAARDYEQIAREILEHAQAVDAEEDQRFGDARGDELPEPLSTPEGRQRWLRDARRRLDERRAREARPIPGPRPKRLKEAKRRLEEDHQVQIDANAAYEDYRRNGRMKNGRRLGAHSPPKPYQPPEAPEGKINLSDLDSRNVKTPRGWCRAITPRPSPPPIRSSSPPR